MARDSRNRRTSRATTKNPSRPAPPAAPPTAARFSRTTPIGDLPELLTAAEAAQAIGCAKGTIYKLLRCGELEAVHVGRLVRVPKRAVRP